MVPHPVTTAVVARRRRTAGLTGCTDQGNKRRAPTCRTTFQPRRGGKVTDRTYNPRGWDPQATDPEFAFYGFGAGGPFGGWLAEIEALGLRCSEGVSRNGGGSGGFPPSSNCGVMVTEAG